MVGSLRFFFVVRLPAIAARGLFAIFKRAPTMGCMSRSPRVLVVEDDTEIAGALRRSLRIEGYEVRVAEDGEEALTESGLFEPDLVVLDLGLPRVDGIEVAQ